MHRVLRAGRIPRRSGDLEVLDHEVVVPLDHAQPSSATLRVFARELRSVEARKALAVGEEQPVLLYLQGGPGGAGIRPPLPDWVDRLLADYRVVMLDQRGTGRSTPVCVRTLAGMLDRRGTDATAEYLSHFRADAIVGDAEALRSAMLGEAGWTTLGQSYGGFVTLTYLATAPESLVECYVTGGLPGLHATAEDVYRLTLLQTVRVNDDYFHTHPEDRETLHRVRDHLAVTDERLRDGRRLSTTTLQLIGGRLGTREGQIQLHILLTDAFVPGSDGEPDRLSDAFLTGVTDLVSFASAPLYHLLHEPIYTQHRASAWAAARERERIPALTPDADPMCLLGEAILPELLAEDPALQPFADVGRLLAERTDWPELYDAERLARNEVPVFAAVYAEDMFVPRQLSLQTAAEVPNVHAWLTDAYLHDGIRDGDGVLAQLRAMSARRRTGD